jgi:hypothetical protein
MSAYEIPGNNASHSNAWGLHRRVSTSSEPAQRREPLCGEFKSAVAKLKRQAEAEDDVYPDFQKATVLAVQRCRRGGKTFTLHKIAAQIST